MPAGETPGSHVAKKKPSSKSAGTKGGASKTKAKTSASTKKPTSTKKPASKKAPTSKKASTKKVVKKSSKKTTKAATSKKVVSKKSSTSKKASTSKPASSKGAPQEPAAAKASATSDKSDGGKAEASKGDDAGKGGKKNITVVTKKPLRRSRPQTKREMPELGGGLLGPGSKKRKPLIPSGPNAPKSAYSTLPGADDPTNTGNKKRRSSLKKSDLDEFRTRLIEKRRDLIGDVSDLERGALSAVDVDRTSSDPADQGSDAADQNLSLGLAEVDRKLIREIDEALGRIEAGTFGVCEITGEAIKMTRLKELPWTRYSIEGARVAERGGR